ncbi:MAG: type II secretion system protein N [Candidatus Babeliales bacterium]
MKHPFWLINSILLITLLLGVSLMLLFRPKKLALESFEPEKEEIKLPQQSLPKIDLAKIYTNDIFNTYSAPTTPTEQQAAEIPAVPQPPRPEPIKPAVKPTPKLLEPLKVTLKGIMLTGNDATNMAVIENTQTKQSKNYRVGDKIEDAQLIRIMKNKISIVRSNGQQETLYVNKRDAQLDQLVQPQGDWSTIIAKVQEGAYTIDPNAFIIKVRNLAQFIDLLNLTTVYKSGKSIGVRVGKVQSNGLATALGLQMGDIITQVNEMPADTTDNRYAIYQTLTKLKLDATIKLHLQRNGIDQTISYTLKEMDILEEEPQKSTMQDVVYPEKTMADVQAERQRIMREQYRFAPTAQELDREKKRTMLDTAPQSTPRKRNVLTELVESPH